MPLRPFFRYSLFLSALLAAPGQAALPPTLLKDIGTAINYNASGPDRFTALGNTGTVVFFARTSAATVSLFRTDGLAGGTALVMDFASLQAAPEPNMGMMAALGNEAVFFKAGAAGQWELWKTNGTAAGTGLVKAVIATLPSGSFIGLPSGLTALPGRVIFSAADTAHGQEIWTSDGTAAGTMMLRDIAPGNIPDSDAPANSLPFSLAAAGSVVYFTANDGVTGSEPWKTDGTPGGTVPVRDIAPGLPGSFPGGYTWSNGLTYFTASGTGLFGEPPQEYPTLDVWRTDGTAAGTIRLLQMDVENQIGGFVPVGTSTVFCRSHRQIADFGGAISDSRGQFYITDGTAAGTTGYSGFNGNTLSPYGILGVLPGGAIVYTARGDGLFPRTVGRVAILDNGGTGELLYGNLQSSAFHGGSFYGVVSRQYAPDTLWKYTPSAPPDQRLTPLTTAYGLTLTSAGGLLLASYGGPSSAPTGPEPYRVNPNGVITLLGDLYPGSVSYPGEDGPDLSINSSIRQPVNLRGTLVFPANGDTGLELWRSDGTTTGTQPVLDLVPGPGGHRFNGFPADAPSFGAWQRGGDHLFFSRYLPAPLFTYELWASDGSTPGTRLLLSQSNGAFTEMKPWANGVWWVEQDTSVSPTRKTLWMSDGTPGGTRVIKELSMAPDGNVSAAILDGLTYTTMTGENQDHWLWSISPDPARSLPIYNFKQPGDAYATVSAMHTVNGALYFFLSRTSGSGGGTTQVEIWRMLPGGLPQRVLVMPNPGPYAGFNEVLPGRTLLYFTAVEGTLDANNAVVRNLWVTDGTAAGTRRATPEGSTLTIDYNGRTRVVGDRLFTSHNGDAAGFELWTCDGTPAGTQRLSGSIPTAEFLLNGGAPDNITTGGDGYVYFDNETQENDLRIRRFWRVSATHPGTPEPFGELPYNAINFFGGTTLPRAVFWAHDRLYASCYTGEGGHEFYWWPAPARATPYSTWASGQGLTLAPADPLADPDKDGTPNLLEYLTGTLPTSAASLAPPTVVPQVFSGSTQATMTFRRMESSGLTVIVESSLDCLSWQSDYIITPDGTATAQPGRRSALFSRTGSNPESISIVTLPAGSHRKKFLRIRAVQP